MVIQTVFSELQLINSKSELLLDINYQLQLAWKNW